MSAFDRFVGLVTGYSKTMIAVMLVATALVSAGAPMVEQASSLDQFQTDSVEADKLDYIEANFSTGPSNTTTAQVIQRQPNGNVLDKESLLASLRYQRTLRTNDETAASLAGDQPTVGIANVIARTAIVREEAADVRRLASEVQRRNASIQRRRAALERNRTALREDRRALRNRSAAVNATSERLRAGLVELRENPSLSVDNVFDRVKANSSVALNETDRAIYREAAADLRNATTDRQASAAFRLGTRGVLADDLRALQRDRAALRERAKRLSERADQLEADVATLRETVDELKAERAELRNATNASLAAQIDQIRSMNASEIDETIGVVLGEGGDSGPFAFMPTDYEPGSTEASATVILVTQEASVANAGSGAASEALTDAQLAMERLAGDRADGHEYLVFGAGIINDEISSSQTDSLLIVGPLALLFVVIALIVAYRDLLDILLGLFGIGAVLGWTFGFMGWAGIDFNQIFVAVPVLLIGLSIDYAIHVFMRHREERTGSGDGPRESMTVALSGVGVALVWVTATTVIGFLSNLVSPVGPIREFGIVSSVGITAAFLVFTVLTPALKVELDELLEGWGVNREKQAFGTGGGAFSAALSVGSTAARRAPLAVIVLALVVTGAAAVGGSQVDTSFSQEDFLAEQPPEWTNELPEPFDPGEYTAKATLQFVNENFVRQNSQAQILIESDGRSVASARALQRVATAEETAASKDVTLVLSNGEPDVRSPLSVMEAVAAENATFNATFTAADTDGDGVPDRNVREVYDTLYTVAPDRAASVIQRENGEYRALRIVVSVKGGSSGEAITTQMRDVASTVNGPGFTVTATGSAILNKIVQDELLQTVIESLIITLVAVFLFLMITYRITEGSASLGAVTLLPVAFSVAWILGTMFLAGIPFNVLTGLITSLTVGLGVAYSIHLSERYNQELERTGDVWEAMETAVTGTGGALLGSAATTVGGFGTLAFAILPPLQQFGIITGMTIVYAFLAAVLVLPSLLVVWTRVFGPDDAAAQIVGDAPDDGGAPSSAPSDGRQSGDGPSTAESAAGDGSAGAVGTADGETAADVSASAETTQSEADDGFVPASVVTDDLRAARRLGRTHVAPGDTVAVEVRIEDAEGRFVLRESVAGDAVTLSVTSVDPEPVDVIERESELNVAFDLDAGSGGENTADGAGDAVGGAGDAADGAKKGVGDTTSDATNDAADRGTATVRYDLQLSDETRDGETVTVDGTVLTGERDRPVGGEATVTVVRDLFERIIAAGEVADADLRTARRRLEAGELSETQFERVRRAWLRDEGRRLAPPDADARPAGNGTGGGTPGRGEADDGRAAPETVDDGSPDRETAEGGETGGEGTGDGDTRGGGRDGTTGGDTMGRADDPTEER